MKTLIFVCFIVFFSAVLKAQNDSKVFGNIYTTSGSVDKIQVGLVDKSSTSVKQTQTDSSGHFEFNNCPSGNYYVTISDLNFLPYRSELINCEQRTTTNLGRIELKNKINVLNEVVIISKKPLIQNFGDRMVLNLQNSPLVAGKSSLEALQLAPGVFVDNNDAIRLRGKAGVLILIDGRQTNLSVDALASLLKSMPANTINKIEVINQPSAKYDASGIAGIINIITIKNKNIGFNGSINTGFSYWKYPKSNEGFNLNYRLKKVNIFGNYNRSNFESYNNLSTLEAIQQQQLTTLFNSNIFFKRNYVNQNYKVGTDYYINDNNTLTFSLDGSISKGQTNTSGIKNIGGSSGSVDSTLTTLTNSSRSFVNQTFIAAYQSVLDTLGGKLDVTYEHSGYRSTILENYNSTFDFLDPPVSVANYLTRSDFPTNIVINSVNANFYHKFRNKLVLETGLKFSYVNTRSNSVFDSLVNSDWVNSRLLSNDFRYRENINSYFLSLNRNFTKIYYRIGFRLENTNSTGESIQTGETQQRNFLNLFPDLFISMQVSNNSALSYSFSRRITRPSYQDLNPFKVYYDRFSYKQGNSFLSPQFINKFDLTYTFKKKYSLNLNYSKTTNFWSYISAVDSATKTTANVLQNIASLNSFAVNVDIPTEISSWWNSNIGLSTSYNKYVGLQSSTLPDLNNQIIQIMIYGSQNFNLPDDFTVSINGYYISKFRSGYDTFRPQSSITAGISKLLLKKSLVLSLNVSDIFYDSTVRQTSQYANIAISSVGSQETRIANLSVSYRFGGKNVRQAKEQKATHQETQRIKSQY